MTATVATHVPFPKADSRPPMGRSVAAYLGLMGYLVVVKGILAVFPAAFRSTQQAGAFDWTWLGVWTSTGLLGLWMARLLGFAEAWDARIPLRQRLWLPASVGLGLGACAVLNDALTHYAAFVAQEHQLPTIHIDFPGSVLIYPGGAIISEVAFRLLPIPLLLWFVNWLANKHGKPLSERGANIAFWSVALVPALVEPLSDLDLLEFGFGVMAAEFGIDLALNLSAAYVFRRSGIIAAVVLRTAFYLLWHVGWGVVTAPA